MGLAAENGFFYRVNSDNKGEKEWNKLIKVNDFLWMDTILNVVQGYTDFTEGTFIEAKESMIIWNYKDTDPEFGRQAAKELATHLENCFSYF